MAQAASAKVSVGSHVWVEDPDEAWIDGQVEEANAEEITVNCSGKTVSMRTEVCSFLKLTWRKKSSYNF